MMPWQIAFAVFAYLVFGSVVVVAMPLFFEDRPQRIPDGAAPAVLFLVGLLWPLAVAAGIGWSVFRLTCSVVGGFVVLWRHLRVRRARLPRATARKP